MRKNESDLIRKKLKETILKMTPYQQDLMLAVAEKMEMSRNVQSGNTQNLKSMVIQRSFLKWSVAERRKTAAA